MDVSSVLPYKGCVPWQGLLLTASLMTCWHLPTTALVSIESVPSHVAEGHTVHLRVHSLPDNLIAFAWFKRVANVSLGIALYALTTKVNVSGPVHTGRESIYSDGSLWIRNVTQKDTGFYTLRTFNRYGKVESTTTKYLNVYASLSSSGRPPTTARLSIESVPPSVAEGESVLLLVHNLPENLRAFFWYKGVIVSKDLEVARHIITRNSSEPAPAPAPAHGGRETVYGNGSLLLHNVTQKDAGFYTLRTLSTDLKAEAAHVQVQVTTSPSTCCDPHTSIPLTIEPASPDVAEGESILLKVRNLPEDLRAFFWYKGAYRTPIFRIAEYSRAMNSVTWGPARNSRETVYTNGSLLLHNATQKDTGFYTLRTLNTRFATQEAHVHLRVHKPVTQPFVRITNDRVAVQGSVVLTCVSTDAGISIRWIFNNQSLQLTERATLSPTKCELLIDLVRREDAGLYQCEVSNGGSSKTSLPVSLVVMEE